MAWLPKVGGHVNYYGVGRRLRPAVITSLNTTNGGLVLRVGHHGETYGVVGGLGILRETEPRPPSGSPKQTNVWTRRGA